MIKAPLNRAAVARSVVARAERATWLPGSKAPAHLQGSLPGDYGFDPLNLGVDAEKLSWFAEAERVHGRWAMLGVAGIIASEIVRPDIFWYTAPIQLQNDLPFAKEGGILGLVAFQVWAMHYVEIRRYWDWKNPGSMDKDPLFGYSLAKHEVGYPGSVFAPFVPGDIKDLKVKEVKNGRLAMLAFVGFVQGAQVYGKGPLALLGDHLANPSANNIFNKAVVIPGAAIVPTCAIPSTHVFQGLAIHTPCTLQGLWP